MMTQAYRSSGLPPGRRNGFGEGLAVGVDENTGTTVGFSVEIFVVIGETADEEAGVEIGIDLGVSVGMNERVDGTAGIVAGVEIGGGDTASTGGKSTTTGT